MTEKQEDKKQKNEQQDVAGKSLSDALTISFGILKIIMIVLVVVFLVSGFKTVEPDEEALVLLFGKIRGVGEERILGPGLHWIKPYPIEEIIKINVEKNVNLAINSFWYVEKDRVADSLDPRFEGYCIVRGQKQNQGVIDSSGSDYNIVHSKWILTYKIDDPERFFRNVYVEDVKPGETYADVIAESITDLLRNLVSDAVVRAMVNYTIDEAIVSQDRIPKHVKRVLQEKLDKIESGIKVVSIQLPGISWPKQVDASFQGSIKAGQYSQKAISEAKSYAENTLNEAAGPVAGELLEVINGDKIIDEQQEKQLWSHLAGQGQEKIANAIAYRTKVVETARANALYLHKILPEYRKRPKLVVQKIYQDTIEDVLNNADEKMIIQTSKGSKGREIRVLLNRDPTIQQKSEEE